MSQAPLRLEPQQLRLSWRPPLLRNSWLREAALAAGRFADEAQRAPWDFPGLVRAFQIAMFMFMGFLVLVALAQRELDPMVRPLLLVFAGVGLTAASSIKPEMSLRNSMAMVGLIVSVMGSYMQIDQLFDVGPLMVAVGVVALIPIAIVAFRTHGVVPTLTVPVVAVFAVMSLATFIIALPAIFIVSGCGVGDESLLTTFGYLGIVVVAFGIAAGVVSILLMWFRRAQPKVENDTARSN